MPGLFDHHGREAVVGVSSGYWFCNDDFVSTAEEGGVDPTGLGDLGFPRDFPAIYAQNAALKSLIGKRGRIAAKRVVVSGPPGPEHQALVRHLEFHPLHSFVNAERAATAGLVVVQGWVVYERMDRPAGSVFVAERYWWNTLPDGKWMDFTPRPPQWPELLLAEAANGAPKTRSLLTSADFATAASLFKQRFQEVLPLPLPKQPVEQAKPKPTKQPAPPPAQQVKPQPTKPAPVKIAPDQVAAPLDYSKWSRIVDSDDEEPPEPVPAAGPTGEDYGVQDLAEGKAPRKAVPVPDYLVGNIGGGGGTNCLLSISRLLDADGKKDGSENSHQLAQAFGKIFHCGIRDHKRQSFYRDALAAAPAGAFVVVIGVGSIIPLLTAARRWPGRGILLEMSTKLTRLAEDLLKANSLQFAVAAVPEGLDREEAVLKAISRVVPANAEQVVIVTERMSHDLLSNGIVPSCVAANAAVRSRAPRAKVSHIPQTVELLATPTEIRSEKLGEFDLRPFNAFRHTTSNEKADFWWWAVRLDNQPKTQVALLGPAQTVCGFDFHRSPEIKLQEVRTLLKLDITARGRCNGVALWWRARCGDLEYSSKPRMAGGGDEGAEPYRPEWKQAVHYLSGETTVFVGDTLEVLVSVTPRFTVRMMQQSPFSVEAPQWVQAPTNARFSATLPLLPYHFLMMTDIERLEVYGRAIKAAVKQQREKLGRRPRVLDAGCGIGLLGMTAALEGADVWLCEAVPQMRMMCREVVAVNAGMIAQKRGLVQLLPPMMSTRLQVGEDIEEKFDIIVSEVLDLWCLGEGVIPTMRHAHNKLLAKGGVMLPGRLVVFIQPLELFVWNQAERDHKVNLSALGGHFKPKFSPMRISQMQHRWLTDEPTVALEIDLGNVPQQPSDGQPNMEGVKLCIRMGGKPALMAKAVSIPVDHSGMLCGYGIWWAADLGNGNVITNSPNSPQRSWKQLVRWLDEPRFVSAGEDVQALACYNDTQVNIEDMYMPRELVDQYQVSASAPKTAASAPATAPAPAAAPAAAPAPAADVDDDEHVVEVD